MIKDKITPELKSRFLQEIRKTIETGKERGFLICKDEKDGLSATKPCEGRECIVVLSSLKSQCNQIELEYQSRNFIFHKHSIEHTDMVICFENNKHLDVPILELCKWSEKPIERDIDEYIEDLDFHLGDNWNSSLKLQLKYFDKEELIGHTYDLLKYIESHRSRDNEEQEIKNFLMTDHRLRMILDALSVVNIIKKEYIDDIINNGVINIEFFVDKDILSMLISENKVIYS